MSLYKAKDNKRNIIILIILIVAIAMSLIYYKNKISTDNYLYSSMIGEDKNHVYNLLYSQENLLQKYDEYDVYINQTFFEMSCDLYFYYDEYGSVKQITYYKNLNNEEQIKDFQRNIDAIINYYSNEYNNTKNISPVITKFDSDFYQYSWTSISGDFYYDLEVNDNQISMTVM